MTLLPCCQQLIFCQADCSKGLNLRDLVLFGLGAGLEGQAKGMGQEVFFLFTQGI